MLNNSSKKIKSTVYDLVGYKGTVVQTLNQTPCQTGTVMVDGSLWPAHSLNNKPIPSGSTITVHAICGIRLIVF